MNRRYLIAGLVAGVGLLLTTVLAVFAAFRFGFIRRLPVIGPDPDHRLEVRNDRDSDQQVAVAYELDGETMEHGPWRIKPNEIWGVTHLDEAGTLTVRVTVDDEQQLESTHEIPIPDDGSSTCTVTLHDSGFVTSSVREDH